MNIRKQVDYSSMYARLNELLRQDLPQMKLYREIGAAVSARSEKGAAVAAAEYLQATYQEMGSFSPRNLRQMYRICGGDYRDKLHLLLDYTDHPRVVADPWYTRDFNSAWRNIEEGCRVSLDRLRA